MTTPVEHQPAQSPVPSNDTLPDTSSTTVPDDANTWQPVDIHALRKARKLMLCALSKKFGNIPGIPIFTHWNTRLECSDTAVHRSPVAGICGNKIHGAYSLALSNLYKDNEDGGDIIIYTGAGGRKRWSDSVPPKRLRLGPQIFDQSWDECRNRALIISFDTGNPIRVIRSWRSNSQYAPLKGYRYDGLYKVAAYWTATGRNGKQICRCRLERLPDQPPIPLRPITMSTRKRQRISYHHRVTPDTEPDTEGIEFNSSPADFSAHTGEESVRFSHPPQQRAVSEASTLIDFNMDQVERDVKVSSQLPERCVPHSPAALPIYRWDPGRNELARAQDPQPMPEDLVAADEEELFLGDTSVANNEGEDEEVDEHRVEDDVTPVPPGTNPHFAIDFLMEGEL